MTNHKSWTVTVTPKLKEDMERTALAAYNNACELFNDARVLSKENRWPRAGALVILSEEEFSKAFILLICAQQNRWDSEIFYALKRHPEKQGIAEAMREYFTWFVDNYNRVNKSNQFSFIPATPAILPSQKQWTEMIDKTKQDIEKQRKDHYKQSLLYIGFDKKAKVTSDPKHADMKEIEDCFKEAERLKEIVEVLLSQQIQNFVKI